jgi:hypothetical protein
MDGDPVDYGPPHEEKTIVKSVNNLFRDSDPSRTKVGAAGRYFTTVAIGGGAAELLVANTLLEVTGSYIDGNILTLNLLENTTEYQSSPKTSEKMNRNFQLRFKVASSPNPLMTQFHASDLEQSVQDFLIQNGQIKKTENEPSIRITYHNLRTWEDSAPPPSKVQEHATCRGIQNCSIRLRHLVFNIVRWDEPQGYLIRVELITSPDVPQTLGFNMNPFFGYVPGLMKSCLTRLVPIGDDGRDRTLVHECKTVVNFASDQATP